MSHILESQRVIRSHHATGHRIDGALKVTGRAKYTADIVLPGMLYAVPVCSAIAKGEVLSIEVASARTMPGVRAIYTHENIGPLYRVAPAKGVMNHIEEVRPALYDTAINYYGQYVALAVAETFVQATEAARAIRVTYRSDTFNTSYELEYSDNPKVMSARGDAEAKYESAAAKVTREYATPPQTHNPIELHATVALWEGDKVTLFETSQGIVNHRLILAQTLGVPLEKVRVVSHFLGSGFGSKLFPWSHSALAADAARKLNAPVKLVLSRSMMFSSVGHRPITRQKLLIGTNLEGRIESLQHDFVSSVSMLDEYFEDCGRATPIAYSTNNLRVRSMQAKRNMGAPTTMRGPGAVPGFFALESAIDETAVQIGVDPISLRLLNEPAIDESRGVPFSSRHTRECLELGARSFGWNQRTPQPGSMERDNLKVGWGVSSCAWDALRFDAEASVELLADGTARVASATQDIGTGTYTALAEIVRGATGLPLTRIGVSLGDTDLPAGPTSGGSRATASLVNAVHHACRTAVETLLTIASQTQGSPFFGVPQSDLSLQEAKVVSNSTARSIPFAEMLRVAGLHKCTGNGKSSALSGKGDNEKYSAYTYGAHFCEVTWDPRTARLRVTRFLSVIDAGRVINPIPARNQIEGAVLMGIGMALFEGTTYDSEYGAPLNSNLADYMLVTNADAPPIEVTFLNYPDLYLNELGARGLGEIGSVGSAAAVTAAVYHATGVRIRKLPVRIEDLL